MPFISFSRDARGKLLKILKKNLKDKKETNQSQKLAKILK